jgi:uncharacterized surface protein with fasciclin (FAS1) repeats
VISPARAPLAALAAALALAGCASNKVASGSETTPSAKPAHHKAAAPAQTIGGAVVDSQATIAANIAKAPNLTALVKAVGAAGLTETLAGPGPYTVFAPTNAAFGRLAPGTVETLLKPENKASLVKLLDYSIVAGRITAADLRHRIAAGNGTTTLTSIEGDPLTVTLTQNIITLTDVNGNKSYVQADDITQSNGIVHVVNGVLIPNLA